MVNPFTVRVWEMHYKSMHGAHYVVAGKECKEFFFKSPDPFPHELERLPERLFISLKEDFIDVQQTTAFTV